MKLDKEDFDTLAFCAFRYALGRRTYITAMVSALLSKHAAELNRATKGLMVEEINRSISLRHAGDDCDVVEWLALRNTLIKDL